MKKTIGIIGGMGPAATCDLLHKIIALTPADRDQDHPRILVDCNSQVPDRTRAILCGGESPVPVLTAMGRRLAEMGAQVLLLPCNTSHYFYDELSAAMPVPLLHMLRVTAEEIRRRGMNRVGVLATDGTIQTGLYRAVLRDYGIEALQPEGEDQRAVMDVIYEGIKGGRSQWDTAAFSRSMEHLFARGAQTMVLGCTELPLAFRLYGLEQPNIDPAEELAKAAIRFSLGKEPREQPLSF